MFALPGDLLLYQLHRMGIGIVQDVRAVAHYLDNRLGGLTYQASSIDGILLCARLQGFNPPALIGWPARGLPDEDAVGMCHGCVSIFLSTIWLSGSCESLYL